jgi:UDP-N-acetylmuramoylalanine--D-glutamate ligase
MKFGIAGFGVVGKSVLKFIQTSLGKTTLATLKNSDESLQVLIRDDRKPSEIENLLIKDANAKFFHGDEISLETLVKECDFTLTSPGLDIEECQKHSDKLFCELDLFQLSFHKPVIGITGTLGKTTTTKLTSKLLELKYKVAVGGNIGIGMLDLTQQQDKCDLAVLELSSFQLRLNKKFAPDFAIWTNFYPNHLDLHSNAEDYFDSKFKLFEHQNKNQTAIFSASLLESEFGSRLLQKISKLKSHICIVSETQLSDNVIKKIPCSEITLFFADQNLFYKVQCKNHKNQTPELIFDLAKLPPITFLPNWLQIIAMLHLNKIDLRQLEAYLATTSKQDLVSDHHNRVEHFATINGVDFYNDSKSTVIQATEAAVKMLISQNRPIFLILGGLNKGVDRSPLMATLKAIKQIKQIYCFGPNCSDFCNANYFATLEELLVDLKTKIQYNDIVLFSPAGTSFDFFKNYEHRGEVFKDLVLKIFKSL